MKDIKELIKNVKPISEVYNEEIVGSITVRELRELVDNGVSVDEIMKIIKEQQEKKDRLIIFSYDVTDEFLKEYKEIHDKDFEERVLWNAIDNLPNIKIQGKPVLSTLLLASEDSFDYEKVVELIESDFEGLPYVIGTVERINREDLYDVNPNPKSMDDNY